MRRNRPTLLAIALLTTAGLLAPPARAEWPAGATVPTIAPRYCCGLNEAELIEGVLPGEYFVTGVAGGDYVPAVSRFTGDSQFGFTWRLDRLPAPHQLNSSFEYGVPVAPDGVGGLLGLYSRGINPDTLRTWRVTPAGTLVPYPSGKGPFVSRSGSFHNAAASAATGGGAWFAWSGGDIVMRVDTAGVRLPTWPVGGKVLSGLGWETGVAIGDDGGGGVLVAGSDFTSVTAIRIQSDASIATGWASTGLDLATMPPSILLRPQLARSGDDHRVLAWIESPAGPTGIRLRCNRFSLAGTLDPAWPVNGVTLDEYLEPSFRQQTFRVVPDGSGGITASWVMHDPDSLRLYARHVLVDGSFAPGYEYGPRLLGTTPFVGSNMSNYPGFAVAAGRNGGLIVLWVDSGSWEVRGRWYDASGNPDPSLGLYESNLDADFTSELENFSPYRAVAAVSDGAGGAYALVACSWGPYGDIPFLTVFAAHATQHSVTAVAPPDRRGPLALSVVPNPARAAFSLRLTLPDDRMARVELLDVTGRRIWSRELRGAGERTIPATPYGPLAPGVYLARVVHGGEARTSRVAILR